ncbi:hypothetical protein [Streptomyces sp. NRRL S-813]|uniref:hypothetical protein n=1 Tax=Streptomyces sp. NRRL S-813 TaxID=1463919 RepID=UPI000565DD68|nr:hypothetical protein [Streptomyces sp. NRRL S-813]
MSEFILMLTRDDVTVPDAADILNVALTTGTHNIGFKDVGLPKHQMRELVDTIHAAGRQAHLEVVSLTERDELRSIEAGLELGFDTILGGTRWRQAARLISGSGINYYPYAGQVIGHPGTLDGSADDILSDIHDMASNVTGINLLAYRHVRLDGDELVRTVCRKSPVPVVVAGSIASLERVRFVNRAGAWGFTIGAAVLDQTVVPAASVATQLTSVLAAAEGDSDE